jgi:DNA polymerase III epsilon subunit-like protein
MILFIDTETTGLLKPSSDFLVQPGICQLAALRLERYPVVDPQPGAPEYKWLETAEFTSLVNPETKFEEQATKTHGINSDAVQGSPTFFSLFPSFAEFVLGCDTWAGYNTSFDKKVLAWQLERYGFERNFPWPPKELDVMKLAKNHMEMQGKRGVKPPTLSEVYENLFGESFTAHDALADIKATVRVWERLNGE